MQRIKLTQAIVPGDLLIENKKCFLVLWIQRCEDESFEDYYD